MFRLAAVRDSVLPAMRFLLPDFYEVWLAPAHGVDSLFSFYIEMECYALLVSWKKIWKKEKKVLVFSDFFPHCFRKIVSIELPHFSIFRNISAHHESICTKIWQHISTKFKFL